MECAQCQDHIARHIDRPLSPEIEAHIKDCPACATARESERRIDMVARESFAPLKLDRDLTGKIIARLPEAEELADLPTPGARLLWWGAGLASAAAILVALVVGDILSDNIQPASQEASPLPLEITLDYEGEMKKYLITDREGIVAIAQWLEEIQKLPMRKKGPVAEPCRRNAVLYLGSGKPGDPRKEVLLYIDCGHVEGHNVDARMFARLEEIAKNHADRPAHIAELRYRLKTKQGDNVREMAETTRAIFLRRIDLLGLPAPEILAKEDGTIIVRIPDPASLVAYKEIFDKVGHLQLAEIGDAELHKAHTYPSKPDGWVWIDNNDRTADPGYPYLQAEKILVQNEPIIDGRYIATAMVNRDIAIGFVVNFTLTAKGAKPFEEATGRLAGKGHIAIILDGKLQSRPFVKSAISKHGQIDGYHSEEEARRIAAILRSGSLPAPVELISEQVIGAPDLSTPEKAWAAFAEALKSGDDERIKAVTTEKGYSSMTAVVSPEDLRRDLDSWSISHWENNGDNSSTIHGPAGGSPSFRFIQTTGSWKMDEMLPGK